MEQKNFHQKLKDKMDEYVHLVYQITKKFPRDEIYGVTSQLRRSALSVILNYIEGFASMRSKVYLNFLEISYGSLQESRYLVEFSLREKYLTSDEYHQAETLSNEIGAMLWSTLKNKEIES